MERQYRAKELFEAIESEYYGSKEVSDIVEPAKRLSMMPNKLSEVAGEKIKVETRINDNGKTTAMKLKFVGEETDFLYGETNMLFVIKEGKEVSVETLENIGRLYSFAINGEIPVAKE